MKHQTKQKIHPGHIYVINNTTIGREKMIFPGFEYSFMMKTHLVVRLYIYIK